MVKRDADNMHNVFCLEIKQTPWPLCMSLYDKGIGEAECKFSKTV